MEVDQLSPALRKREATHRAPQNSWNKVVYSSFLTGIGQHFGDLRNAYEYVIGSRW